MKWLPLVTALLAGPALLTACTSREPQTPGIRTRTVAFDNVYGAATSLTVHVAVDGGAEQRLTATCNRKECSFRLPLADGSHLLALSVEQDGKRSSPTTVAVDTSESR